MFDRYTTDLLMSKRQHIMRVLKSTTTIDCHAIGHTDLATENDVELVGMTDGGFQITYKDHWMLTSAECQDFNDSIRASYYMGADEIITWVEMLKQTIAE